MVNIAAFIRLFANPLLIAPNLPSQTAAASSASSPLSSVPSALVSPTAGVGPSTPTQSLPRRPFVAFGEEPSPTLGKRKASNLVIRASPAKLRRIEQGQGAEPTDVADNQATVAAQKELPVTPARTRAKGKTTSAKATKETDVATDDGGSTVADDTAKPKPKAKAKGKAPKKTSKKAKKAPKKAAKSSATVEDSDDDGEAEGEGGVEE